MNVRINTSTTALIIDYVFYLNGKIKKNLCFKVNMPHLFMPPT